jgi:hypothetical protein
MTSLCIRVAVALAVGLPRLDKPEVATCAVNWLVCSAALSLSFPSSLAPLTLLPSLSRIDINPVNLDCSQRDAIPILFFSCVLAINTSWN